MIRRLIPFLATVLAVPVFAAAVAGGEPPCPTEPEASCYGLTSVEASLSTTQAGDHPDLTIVVDLKKNPESGFAFAETRSLRFELPPGFIGNPNVLGVPQQCTAAELFSFDKPGGGCPNGSQVGNTDVAIDAQGSFREPVYMMIPPGGDTVARLGTIAVLYPVFIDFKVRSESDYGITGELVNSPSAARIRELHTTTWAVPADPSHDEERCTPLEVFPAGCVSSPPRPPGSRPLPFFTNPTRCGVPLQMSVAVASWVEPERFDTASSSLPEISGCNSLPFGPSLTVEPTSHRTSTPTGLDLTIQLPAAEGVHVLEPSQARDIRIDLPQGIAINPGSADGLDVCSAAEVKFGERVASQCPNAAKMASTEFEIGALPRRMKGAIYLREPEPGNLFRIWIVADDLGAHVKFPGQLEVDKATGQIKSVVLDLPQVPLRETKLTFKSGFRAPLMTPSSCGEYLTHYEFTPWSGGPAALGDTPMQISERCEGGGFSPTLSAGSTVSRGGAFSPFTFTIGREDSEEDLASLDITLPRGVTASFAGIPRCEGADSETGNCPAGSRIGKTVVADGAGPSPLWVPQPGKDPTAVYLGGPYKGAPLSIVAVVPAQAGPFDLGLEVVRSAVYVNPETAEATAKADPLPQIIEGIPITYKIVNVQLDRPEFSLNPTSCAQKQTTATLASTGGKTASPASPYAATDCGELGFKPKLSLRLFGGTHRGAHPRLKAVLQMPAGGANIAGTQVTLPPTAFVDNEHFDNVCTRVDFAADRCPAGSAYGRAVASSPLLDFPLEGPVYLRTGSTSKSGLPDLVAALSGPSSMPIEVDVVGHIDSKNGGLRTTFEAVPDAPVSKFVLQMQGGRKGLIQNSDNLCRALQRATARFTGQNGKVVTLRPTVRNGCRKRR